MGVNRETGLLMPIISAWLYERETQRFYKARAELLRRRLVIDAAYRWAKSFGRRSSPAS